MIPLQMWLCLSALFALAILWLYLKMKLESAARRAQLIEEKKLRVKTREEKISRRKAV